MPQLPRRENYVALPLPGSHGTSLFYRWSRKTRSTTGYKRRSLRDQFLHSSSAFSHKRGCRAANHVRPFKLIHDQGRYRWSLGYIGPTELFRIVVRGVHSTNSATFSIGST